MKLTEWDYSISDIIDALVIWAGETDYDLTYTITKAQEYLWLLFNDPETAIFVTYEEDDFRGFAIASKASEFQNENFGFLTKLYVLPTARGTTAGRELMMEVVDWFDANDCVYSWATPTAAIGLDGAFTNLLGKYGYQSVGQTLMRKQHEQSK